MGVVQFLKDGGVLEGPGQFRREPPLRMRGKIGFGPRKKIRVVRPMCEPHTGFRAGGQGVEQLRLQQAADVMALFGPGIGKENKNSLEADMHRQRGQCFGRIGFDKGDVAEIVAGLFADGAGDALGRAVHPEAARVRVRLRVSGEKMAVPAAEFEHEGNRSREEFSARGHQGGFADGPLREDSGRGKRRDFFHRRGRRERREKKEAEQPQMMQIYADLK